MKNAIIALLIIFSVFNLVLIRGYEDTNDKLQKANKLFQLMSSYK